MTLRRAPTSSGSSMRCPFCPEVLELGAIANHVFDHATKLLPDVSPGMSSNRFFYCTVCGHSFIAKSLNSSDHKFCHEKSTIRALHKYSDDRRTGTVIRFFSLKASTNDVKSYELPLQASGDYFSKVLVRKSDSTWKLTCNICGVTLNSYLYPSCRVCSVIYCTSCSSLIPYLKLFGLCTCCYTSIKAIVPGQIDPLHVRLLSQFVGSREGLCICGPIRLPSGRLILDILAPAYPLDRLNVLTGIEDVLESTQYDERGMPMFVADLGKYTIFANDHCLPHLCRISNSPSPNCRIEVTFTDLGLSFDLASVVLRTLVDIELGPGELLELTAYKQARTELSIPAALLGLPPSQATNPFLPDPPLSDDVVPEASRFASTFTSKTPYGTVHSSLAPILD
ncbi:hypothetical protein GMRT_11671 [Giardia muris]|uniref:Uncharacterized protein n=1 Tax=Giardia muris TaxID=5742 RepID=A0A4Z1SXJ2_GIAMU|nr:hypothetical protein GMRT_11671 [Giardia muris]|eukprot:TNJ29535.1 hypothetical protein GMRT_11671 [Giardia muris]